MQNYIHMESMIILHGVDPNEALCCSVENVSQFKYLGSTVTNYSLIHQEIKSRLNSVNTCYYSIQNLLSSVKKLNNQHTQ
jgi:hypothetical protein